MKVYELINELSKYPAGKDVCIVHGEKQFVPYETDDNGHDEMGMPVIIFAKKDT